MKYFYLIFFAGLIAAQTTFSQGVLDVSVQGISNATRDSKQIDRDEAIIDAKLKAIEKAGVSIESATRVENFQLKSDWIESKASAVILPGFEIVDVGYGEDGLYHVVLIGKIKKSQGNDEVKIEDQELQYAKNLLERKMYQDAVAILNRLAGNVNTKADVREEAMALLIRTQIISRVTVQELIEDYYLFKSYFPQSKYLSSMKIVISNRIKEEINTNNVSSIPDFFVITDMTKQMIQKNPEKIGIINIKPESNPKYEIKLCDDKDNNFLFKLSVKKSGMDDILEVRQLQFGSIKNQTTFRLKELLTAQEVFGFKFLSKNDQLIIAAKVYYDELITAEYRRYLNDLLEKLQ